MPLLAGLGAAVVGFFLELSYTSSRTVNGVVVECDYHDVGPLLVGPVAAVFGLVTAARSGRTGAQKGREAAIGLLCVAVGVLHVLRGLGIVDLDLSGGNPC